MKGFDSRRGAIVLAVIGATYLVAATAMGHNARSEAPLDLRPQAAEAGLDVVKAAALLVQHPGTAILDVRLARDFALYHLAGAENEPGASAARVVERAKAAGAVLVVAATDPEGLALVDSARQAAPGLPIHFVKDGARGFYLAFELPVPLFSEQPPPHGYHDAVATLRLFLANRAAGDQKAAASALDMVARAGYRPTLLKGSSAPKAGGGQKKISGGCG